MINTMTIPGDERILRDRRQAARLLSEQLRGVQGSNSVLVAIPNGGVPIGYYMSRFLKLPLQVIISKKIRHPADPLKTIGCVCADEALLTNDAADIPHDYVGRQVGIMKQLIREREKEFSSAFGTIPLEGKQVILVDDVMRDSTTAVTCVKSIRRQNPLRIIVAVPVASASALRALRLEADDVVFLEEDDNAGEIVHEDFPRVSDEEVEGLVALSRGVRTVGTGQATHPSSQRFINLLPSTGPLN